MTTHFFKEIEKLKKRFLSLGALVEESLNSAVRAIEEEDESLAQQVIASDGRVDQYEVEVEEECLKVLALHQPVATDLRFVVAVLKINNDLERIGDLAVNIAERAAYIARKGKSGVVIDFGEMATRVKAMLRDGLDALVNLDVVQAAAVCARDDEVDMMNRETFRRVQEMLRDESREEVIELLIHLLSVSRHLERIADHATNIAEDVIYMIEGRIVRHRPEAFVSVAGSAPASEG